MSRLRGPISVCPTTYVFHTGGDPAVQDTLVVPDHSAIYVTTAPLRTWSNPKSLEAKLLR